MKKSALLLVLMSVGSYAFAATTTAGKTSAVPNPHPNLHQVNMALKSEYQQVLSGMKSGKIPTTQGTTLKANLKSIRQQEVAYLKQNSTHDLTSTQTSELNSSLATVEQTLTSAGVPVVTPTTH